MASQHIVAVMGVTGAGKSSFVKLVTGDPTVSTSDSQKADTKLGTPYDTFIRGRKISLVDAPGFDNEDLTDADVLKMLLDWLVAKYKFGQKLSGIIYLHHITDTRMRASSMRNLKMFRQLIGNDVYKTLTLATSCWSLVPAAVGSARETELKTDSSFWRTMIAGGAKVVRLPDDSKPARDLVCTAANHTPISLRVQRDVVGLGISFANLAVAKTVNYELEQARKQRAVEMKRHREESERQRPREAEEQQRELARLRTRNERTQHFLRTRRNCAVKSPYGRCDKIGCSEKLRHWNVAWHCSACYSLSDNYWHCGRCGNGCENEEHPGMMKLDNSDDCTVM